MPEALADVLARARRDVDTYQDAGDRIPPSLVARRLAELEQSEEAQLLAWVPETRACTRSGHDARWFKRRRAEWAAAGLARETPRGWEYRAAIIPQRDAVDDIGAAVDAMLGKR